MPDRVKEKLVEIIQNSVGGCAKHWAEVIADGLIANGVTVQELGGCEYCRADGEGFRKFNGAFWLANPFHGGEWFIRAGNCKPRKIHFCPMCGRRLPQPPKGE